MTNLCFPVTIYLTSSWASVQVCFDLDAACFVEVGRNVFCSESVQLSNNPVRFVISVQGLGWWDACATFVKRGCAIPESV